MKSSSAKKCWANVSIYCRGSVLLAQILQTVHNFENFPMFYNLDILITYHVLVVHLTWDLGKNESMMHFLESKFSVWSTFDSLNFFIWSWFTNFPKNIMISAIFSLFSMNTCWRCLYLFYLWQLWPVSVECWTIAWSLAHESELITG